MSADQHVRMLNGDTFVFDGDGRICCPSCGSGALHLSRPEVKQSPNSAYMTVSFKVECEGCNMNNPYAPPFVLFIYSGKGQASMEWERFR